MFNTASGLGQPSQIEFPFHFDTQLDKLNLGRPVKLSQPQKKNGLHHTHMGPVIQYPGLLTPDSYVRKPTKTIKRGVNSWMAFRSYYSKIFTRMQQKNTSGLLKIMWDQDPFKAKWSIIARAYTNIRDQVGKANAPIEAFFSIVCPRMGIIGVDDYFARMEWVAETNEGGSVFLFQKSHPDLQSFPSEIMSSNMTEKDVVHFCAFQKYLSQTDALAITGLTTARRGPTVTQASQQGLLASSPALQIKASDRCEIVQDELDKPVTTICPESGFNVDQLLGESFNFPQSEYYNLEEGPFGLDDSQALPAGNQWEFFDIYDPNALDSVLE